MYEEDRLEPEKIGNVKKDQIIPNRIRKGIKYTQHNTCQASVYAFLVLCSDSKSPHTCRYFQHAHFIYLPIVGVGKRGILIGPSW